MPKKLICIWEEFLLAFVHSSCNFVVFSPNMAFILSVSGHLWGLGQQTHAHGLKGGIRNNGAEVQGKGSDPFGSQAKLRFKMPWKKHLWQG